MESALGYGRSWRLKIFLDLPQAAILFMGAKILAILVGSHLGHIPEKFESHWPMGLGGNSI